MTNYRRGSDAETACAEDVIRQALQELTAARLSRGESAQTAMPKARLEEAAFKALLAMEETAREVLDEYDKWSEDATDGAFALYREDDIHIAMMRLRAAHVEMTA